MGNSDAKLDITESTPRYDLAANQRLFNEVIENPKYRADLLARSHHFTKNPTAADDLLQETLLRAWASLAKLFIQSTEADPKKYLMAYINRILINSFISNFRRNKLIEFRGVDLRGDWPFLSDGGISERQLLAADSLAKASPHFDGINPDQFRVLVLHALGYSHGEIAVAMEVREGTVMSRLFRAREMVERHGDRFRR